MTVAVAGIYSRGKWTCFLHVLYLSPFHYNNADHTVSCVIKK